MSTAMYQLLKIKPCLYDLFSGVQRLSRRRLFVFAVRMGLFVYFILLTCALHAAEEPTQNAAKRGAAEEAALVVWSRPIALFRSQFEGLSPQDRIAAASARIQTLPRGAESAEIKIEKAKIGTAAG